MIGLQSMRDSEGLSSFRLDRSCEHAKAKTLLVLYLESSS